MPTKFRMPPVMKSSSKVTQGFGDLFGIFVAHYGFFCLSVLGEIVVNEVNFVRKCIATDTSQYDLWGKLICSNFKISFITDDPMPLQVFISILLSFVKTLTLSRIYSI